MKYIIYCSMYVGKSRYLVEDYTTESWGIHCEEYEDCYLLEWWQIVLKVCTNLIHSFICSFMYFTFHWSYTDVELVMYTFSVINKASVRKLCLTVAS